VPVRKFACADVVARIPQGTTQADQGKTCRRRAPPARGAIATAGVLGTLDLDTGVLTPIVTGMTSAR